MHYLLEEYEERILEAEKVRLKKAEEVYRKAKLRIEEEMNVIEIRQTRILKEVHLIKLNIKFDILYIFEKDDLDEAEGERERHAGDHYCSQKGRGKSTKASLNTIYFLSRIYFKVLFICFIENGLLMLLNAELGGG